LFCFEKELLLIQHNFLIYLHVSSAIPASSGVTENREGLYYPEIVFKNYVKALTAFVTIYGIMIFYTNKAIITLASRSAT